MKVNDLHYLEGVERDEIPGGRPMAVRRFLVIHFTAGWLGKDSIDYWRTPAAKGANAHIVIERDGTIIQVRPFNRTCGHAGKNSKWQDPRTGTVYRNALVNGCSIGIELANAGPTERAFYPSTMGELAAKPIPRVTAKHKSGGPLQQWEEYPLLQYEAVLAVAATLVGRYNLDDVVGHDDIAPAWKNDPGPAFPMVAFRKLLGFPRTR